MVHISVLSDENES